MATLRAQIEALEDLIGRLCEGDSYVLDRIPSMLDRLRESAVELEQRQDELASLYEVGQEIVSISHLEQLLESILDRAIMLAHAERGFLVLYDAELDDFQVAVARRFAQGEKDDAQIEISHAVIRRVLAQREPVVTTNAQEDPRFQSSHSIVAYQIRSVMATPLEAKEELIGAIYVDTQLSSRLFGESDLALLSAMANQAAVAIQLARLYKDLQTRNDELRQTLMELQETQDELIRAERLSVVGRMASSIIHDLKNPMTTIKGYAYILAKPDIPGEKRKRYAKTISHSVDTLVEMTQEVLDYARGGGTLKQELIQVKDFLDELFKFVEPDFQSKGQSLSWKLDYDGPLLIDGTKMRRALYNVIVNAQDAMGAGGNLCISTSLREGCVEILLSDTGPGIPPALRTTIFEPFVTFGKPRGTGLGLAIARKIAEDHGGTLSAENNQDRGATFAFRIPALVEPPSSLG